MYIIIIMLPLLSFMLNSMLGRKIGKQGAIIISNIAMIISTIMAYIGSYEIIIRESVVRIDIREWVMSIGWTIQYDELTIMMCIIVLSISSAVFIYTSSYMENEKHLQRFYGYLSLFIFFMLVVITSNNYLVLFLGWEGMKYALNGKRNNKGPHNKDVIAVMIGILLGEGELEKRSKGIRLKIKKSNKNVEDLMWLHKFFASRGYCNPIRPKLVARVVRGGVEYSYKINTYTYGTLEWLYEMFYKDRKEKGISLELEKYITPLSIAVWSIVDYRGGVIRVSTKNLKREEVEKLSRIIKRKWNIESKVLDGKIEIPKRIGGNTSSHSE